MNANLTERNVMKLWERLITATKRRGGTNAFRSPASGEQILALESAIGIELPVSLRAFLKCQNGCIEYSDQLVVGNPFLSTDEIASDWKTNCDVDEDSSAELGETQLSDMWWHESCVPFAGSDGDCSCIDAKTGKVYSHNHGMGGLSGPNYPSLVEWLGGLADRVDDGQGEIVDGKLCVEH